MSNYTYFLQDAIDDCTSESERLTDGGSIIVRRIIPYESLNAELAEVFSVHGIPFDGVLRVKARSKPRDLYTGPEILFSKSQIETIREKFAFEFALYDGWHMRISDV